MIGIDIEQNDRFNDKTLKELKRIFSAKEIEYAKQFKFAEQHFCGFFCVKEALVKALDNKELIFNKISVIHNASGKPYIENNVYIKTLLKQYNLTEIEVSISHTKDYSTAVVKLG